MVRNSDYSHAWHVVPIPESPVRAASCFMAEISYAKPTLLPPQAATAHCPPKAVLTITPSLRFEPAVACCCTGAGLPLLGLTCPVTTSNSVGCWLISMNSLALHSPPSAAAICTLREDLPQHPWATAPAHCLLQGLPTARASIHHYMVSNCYSHPTHRLLQG